MNEKFMSVHMSYFYAQKKSRQTHYFSDPWPQGTLTSLPCHGRGCGSKSSPSPAPSPSSPLKFLKVSNSQLQHLQRMTTTVSHCGIYNSRVSGGYTPGNSEGELYFSGFAYSKRRENGPRPWSLMENILLSAFKKLRIVF